jgi:hypothetical protein
MQVPARIPLIFTPPLTCDLMSSDRRLLRLVADKAIVTALCLDDVRGRGLWRSFLMLRDGEGSMFAGASYDQ